MEVSSLLENGKTWEKDIIGDKMGLNVLIFGIFLFFWAYGSPPLYKYEVNLT